LYDQLVEIFHDAAPTGEMDKLYLKLAYFYRADCLYDLQSYEESIAAYDAAAMRYQDDSSALSAYVQIVNAYCEEGKFLEAKRANERAKTLLARMPAEAFNDGAFPMPKAYWQKWLKWTGDAGMWNGLEDEQRMAAQRLAKGGR
jgi:tetratricopeptide (TPR) repeat protein